MLHDGRLKRQCFERTVGEELVNRTTTGPETPAERSVERSSLQQPYAKTPQNLIADASYSLYVMSTRRRARLRATHLQRRRRPQTAPEADLHVYRGDKIATAPPPPQRKRERAGPRVTSSDRQTKHRNMHGRSLTKSTTAPYDATVGKKARGQPAIAPRRGRTRQRTIARNERKRRRRSAAHTCRMNDRRRQRDDFSAKNQQPTLAEHAYREHRQRADTRPQDAIDEAYRTHTTEKT